LFDLLPHILNGLTLGLLFALIALGFMLIVGLMEQINLAHGSLFALGAYLAMQLMGPRPPFPPDIAQAWLALPLGWRYVATRRRWASSASPSNSACAVPTARTRFMACCSLLARRW